jgi:hypothetical protein
MRAGMVLLALLALAFPVGLAFAVYVTAEPSLAAQPVPAAITQRAIAEPSRTTTEEEKRTTTDRSGSDRCLEAEHRNDPECLSGGSGSGSSGSGDSSGSDDNSGSGSSNSGSGSSNSGSGSSNSGSGSGDD